MKIIILGAKGMLGSALTKGFADGNEVVAWDREELDITDKDAVGEKIYEAQPDAVINAAAYTDVDGTEENQELANKINGEAVGYLAQACREAGAAFVHYSTDYVFDGKNPEGYREDDQPGPPVNAYGRSKLLGEQQLFSLARSPRPPRWHLIRTSWLYGINGKNFVDTMLRLGKEKDRLQIVNDQHGNPTYVKDLAEATEEIIVGTYEPGVYHVTNKTPPEGITWFDFAVEIFAQADITVSVTPCASEEFPRPAKRPAYSMLINTKLPQRRDWREALAEYLASKQVSK